MRDIECINANGFEPRTLSLEDDGTFEVEE